MLGYILVSSFAFAKEPLNLSEAKQAVIRYHDSGEYIKEVNAVIEEATRFLKMRLAHPKSDGKKLAVVFDIDETSLSNYPTMLKLDFGGTLEQIRQAEKECNDPVLAPTLTLYRFAKANNVAVFFVTGRHADAENATVCNLEKAGYEGWDGLFFKPREYWYKPAGIYKTAVRKQLTELGYDIVLNIGDQNSDLEGGYAEKSFKLPGPYYLIP